MRHNRNVDAALVVCACLFAGIAITTAAAWQSGGAWRVAAGVLFLALLASLLMWTARRD